MLYEPSGSYGGQYVCDFGSDGLYRFSGTGVILRDVRGLLSGGLSLGWSLAQASSGSSLHFDDEHVGTG